jgi:hypothetical protein
VKGSDVAKTARRLAQKQPPFKECVTAHWSSGVAPIIQRGSSPLPKLWFAFLCEGRGALLLLRSLGVNQSGALASENDGMSSVKACGNHVHRKSEVSYARLIRVGLVGPKLHPKGESEG